MKTLNTKLGLTVKIPRSTSPSIFNSKFDQRSECNYIIDNIFLSSYQISLDYEFLKKQEFTHIINCAGISNGFKYKVFNDFDYLIMDIKDEPGFDLLKDYVQLVINYIENAKLLSSNSKILIHCFEGISRAPTLLSAYLMWKFGHSQEQAVKFIKEKRPCVDINFGFMCQLAKLEEVWEIGIEK
jgi:hypothetical protein